MLNGEQRSTILELHAKKVSTRRIAKTLEISRLRVRRVIQSDSSEMATRGEMAEACYA